MRRLARHFVYLEVQNDFVAGAALCDPQSADFEAGAGLCALRCSLSQLTLTYLHFEVHNVLCISALRGSQSVVHATKSALRGSQSAVPATKSALRGSQSAVPATESALQGSQSAVPATKSTLQGSQSAVPAMKSALQGSHATVLIRRFAARVLPTTTSRYQNAAFA